MTTELQQQHAMPDNLPNDEYQMLMQALQHEHDSLLAQMQAERKAGKVGDEIKTGQQLRSLSKVICKFKY